METINKSLKEWNAVIEALGSGKQTVVIRKYGTTNKEFVLFPTFKYSLKDGYLNNFQEEHQNFVENHALPKKQNDKVEIKYFARCEKVVKKAPSRVGTIKDNYIWDPDYVKSYLGNSTAYIWLLRVYELKKPYNVDITPHAIIFANLKEDIPLSGLKPVLSDKEFSRIYEQIK